MRRRPAQRHLLLGGLVGLALGASLAACGETARVVSPDRGLHDPVASTRMTALRDVSRSPDPRYVPDLIEMLDDEDPGIRLLAGAALEQMTGRDTGYLAHASSPERREQVMAWRRWWDETQGRSAAPGAPAPSPAPTPAPAVGMPPPAAPTPPPPPAPPAVPGEVR